MTMADPRIAAAVVQVVGVVVVADQHQVHRAELVLGDRRAGGLGEVAVRTGVVEGGVADNAQAADVEDGGRAAHHHGRALLPRDHGFTLATLGTYGFAAALRAR